MVGDDFYDQMDYDESEDDEEIFDADDDEWLPTSFFIDQPVVV
jgi:hypothetical protein